MTWLAERANPRSLFRTHWDHESGRIGRSRDSVLDCGSPLPLSVGTGTCQSARGLTQSKTWRTLGRFMESLHDFRNAHGADEPLDTKLCCRCDKVLHAVNHRFMESNPVRRPLFCLAAAMVLTAATVGGAESAPKWQARQAPLMTRWAARVDPTHPLPEYPRPQMVRTQWLNLNGLWDYAIRPVTAGKPAAFDGKILVPFPIESALSGVMKQMEEKSTLWYRRTIIIPREWKDRRVRLHCGAVDWQCRVFVNDRPIGQHRGGYDRFSFDLTEGLQWEGENTLTVAVNDFTEGDQPRGKQTRAPEGIFYSSSSGIWQTLWLEPVAPVCIDDLKMTPDLDAKGLRLRVASSSLADSLRVEAVAFAAGVEVSRISGQPNAELFLPIARPKRWSPDDPFLYDLQVRLMEGERVLDQVTSYFGLRKVAILPDEQGTIRIALNDQFLFQIGVLDQGFWPDGIYTAPTDEALQSDLAFLKQAGFNLVRKHIKVEPERWYYWCDRMGLLVWQDMPSGNNATAEGRRAFETELLQMVRNLHNHPSIILWVLFNEGWGQYDTERLTDWLKKLDPSRLVDNASGWTDTRAGDIVDAHSYPGPEAPESDSRRAAVLGEFGGLGLPIEGHSWSSNRWGYKLVADTQTLATAYSRLLERVWTLHDRRGLSAAVYTQITDVETECNGLLTYDRSVAKLNPSVAAAANHTDRRIPLSRVIIADALQAPVPWKYTLDAPGPNWFQPGFDTSGWRNGASGFGTPPTPGTRVTTLWNTANIWLRREFVLSQEDLRGLKLEVHHDEDADIYLNGVLAANLPGFTSAYEEFDILPAAAATLKPGTNTLAVHCHQTAGGQYIDVGLVAPPEAKPARRPENSSP